MRHLVYALAVSTRRFGVQVHALCAMSTHLHLVVTDVRGVLPAVLGSGARRRAHVDDGSQRSASTSTPHRSSIAELWSF